MLKLVFVNDGTGTEEVGNYDFKVYINEEEIKSGRVESHVRKDGWHSLVIEAAVQSKVNDMIEAYGASDLEALREKGGKNGGEEKAN
jgi:hypothetical protein